MFVFDFVVLFVGLQLIWAQSLDDLPLRCREPPPANSFECCIIPPFFEPQDFEDCGIKRTPGDNYFLPKSPVCSEQVCLLDKHGLTRGGKIDPDAMVTFLNEYAEKNEAFGSAIDAAKKRCLRGDLPMPPNNCEATSVLGCLTAKIIVECPIWNENDDCKTFKHFIDDCKTFLKF